MFNNYDAPKEYGDMLECRTNEGKLLSMLGDFEIARLLEFGIWCSLTFNELIIRLKLCIFVAMEIPQEQLYICNSCGIKMRFKDIILNVSFISLLEMSNLSIERFHGVNISISRGTMRKL